MRMRLCGLFGTTALLALAASRLAGQTADTARRVELFPRSLVPSAPPALNRFQVLAREVDSASAVGRQMQMVAADREQSTQQASRMLLVSQAVHGFGRRTVGADWVSAVTAAGVMQLSRTPLFTPGQSWWRNDSQFLGIAGLAGGASWLLSNLTVYSPRFGTPHIHPAAAH
jgi:hypothetical protein